MNRFLLFLLSFLIVIFFSPSGYCTDFPQELKGFLKSKYNDINFKIDNSFEIKGTSFLPLPPGYISKPTSKKIEISYSIKDKNDKSLPKLMWFSNGWAFVKILKQKDSTQTILALSEIGEKYKQSFLKRKFPSDLVVPNGLVIKQELSSLVGDLPIKIINQEGKEVSNIAKSVPSLPNLNGILYLTSPDTGKIIYLNLNDLSMIYNIQTIGAPWEISFDKTNKLLFITDFAKDQIYELKPMEKSVLKSISLNPKSSPRDIEISIDGSLLYVLESSSNDFAIYQTNEEKYFIKTKLPPNPTSFSILKDLNLVAITCPSANEVVFLNTNDFSIVNHVMVGGGPEKIIPSLDGMSIFTSNRNENTISEISIENMKIKNLIPVGEKPVALTLHPDGKSIYVGNGKSNTISIVNLETDTVTDTIDLPVETQFPGDIQVTSDGHWLIITSETTNIISIIDLTLKKVEVELDVGATTHGAYIIENKQ